VTAWWLSNVADVRVLRDFKASPRERHAVEQPHLLPLPTCDFRHRPGRYRHVNVEGFITQRPERLFGALVLHRPGTLPVRVTESEVIIYSISLDEIARHALLPRATQGARQLLTEPPSCRRSRRA